MRVLLLHGWGGSDYPHWQSFIASGIAKEYGCVDFVRLPDFDTPQLQEWIDCASSHIKSFQPDVVLCHSLGNTLWFHMCNNKVFDHNIKKLYLVAPPSNGCSIEDLREFFPVELPQNLYADKVELIVSDDDPYMRLDEAKALQEHFDIPLEVLHKAGHINTQSGYGKWDEMLQKLRKDKEELCKI